MIVAKKRFLPLVFFLFSLLSTSPSFAASSDIARTDAETVWETIAAVERMAVPRDFEAAFGEPIEAENLGANVYRNLDWRFSLVSADVSLDLHVGFNYGRMAEWSMSIDFGGDADAGRRYFIALSRGFERLTGHVSPVVRNSTYYPLATDRVLAVSAADGDSWKLFLAPNPAATAGRFAAPVVSVDLDHAFTNMDQ